MLMRHRNESRRGTTLLEAVLTITALLTLILGTIDLGMAVFRQQVLSQAARQGVRKAIVHGKLAPSGWNGGPWGPSSSYPTLTDPTTWTYTVNANNSTDYIAQAIKPSLSGMDTSQVTITVQWIDGSNSPEKRVRVTLATTWQPLLFFIFGNQTVPLGASSTMPIAH